MLIKSASKNTKILYQNRFCEQEDFDVIISGTTDMLKRSEERISFRISSKIFDKVETIHHSKRHSHSDRTVCERSNVWTVCSRIPNVGKYQMRPSLKFVDSFRIYLNKTDQWVNVIQIPDDRENFIACSFMKNIYVFGGFTKKASLKSCYKYDTNKSKWIYIASMIEYRQLASCTVFRGKIVLTGGQDVENGVTLCSVI